MPDFRRSIALAAALSLFAAADSQAQQAIGFKLGPSFSTLSIDVDEEISPKVLTRVTGGGFLRFDLGAFAAQPELMYVSKGAKFSETEAGETFDFDLRLEYIEIPVLLVLPIDAGPGLAPFLYGGPAFAFEVGCTVGFSFDGLSGSSDCDEDEDDFLERKKFDIGAMFGAGFSFPTGPGAVLLEGRYNFGLINLNDSTEDGTLRNRSGAVLLGYSFPFGG